MTALEWSEELSVGVKEIDDQHKEIIRRTNQLVDAFGEEKQGEQLDQLINFMASYVVDHFKDEEEQMARHNYPDMRDHVAEHERITEQVRGLEEKFQYPPDALVVPVIEELFVLMGRLLLDHIHKTDKRLAKFLIAKNEYSKDSQA